MRRKTRGNVYEGGCTRVLDEMENIEIRSNYHVDSR